MKKADHDELLAASRPFYAQLLLVQEGKCALCDRPEPPNRKLDTDHDHKLMHIRGLLCWRCNKFLQPWFTPEWLRRAAEYVEKGAADVDAGDYVMLRKKIGATPRGAQGVILRATEPGWVRVRGANGTFEAPTTALSRLVRRDSL